MRILESTSANQMWQEDIQRFLKELDLVEEKEELDRLNAMAKAQNTGKQKRKNQKKQ